MSKSLLLQRRPRVRSPSWRRASSVEGQQSSLWTGIAPDAPCSAFRSSDPFAKKDWYEIKAPSMFSSRNVGKTLVTRTQGTKVHLRSTQPPSRVMRLGPGARRLDSDAVN